MAKIKVKSGNDIRRLGRAFLRRVKNDIVSTVAEDTVETINKKSDGRLEAKSAFSPNKVTIYVEKTRKDPEGKKAMEVESQTKAVKEAYNRLSSKAVVSRLINEN